MKQTKEEIELRKLESELTILKDSIEVFKKQISDGNSRKNHLTQIVKKQKLLQEPLTVSDHALVRYIERVYNLNVDKLRDEIKEKIDKEALYTMSGKGKFISDDITFIIQENKIVTIY